MIKVATDGVTRDVSEIKISHSSVVRNIASGFFGGSTTLRQFFGKLYGLDHFDLQVHSVLYKSLSDSAYTTLSNPTSYGETTYGTGPDVAVWLYENGNMTVYAYNSMTIVLRAYLYGVFSNGNRIAINNLYKRSSSSIVISGTASNEKNGTGSSNATLQIIGNYGSFSAPWSASSLGSDNPYTFYILAGDYGGSLNYMRVSVENLEVTVDGVSYPITLVL